VARKRTKIAYWLVPAEPWRELFVAFIRILARELDGPRFEPHVTLGVMPEGNVSPDDVLKGIKAEPLSLRVGDVACSAVFTKTLFVCFHPDKALDRLAADLAGAHGARTGRAARVGDPHLSLLYKKLSAPAKREFAAAIQLLFGEVVFDAMKAVRCVAPTTTRAEVEAWQTIASLRLRAK
jgi:hypothetical protein